MKVNEVSRLFDNLVRVLVYSPSEEDHRDTRDQIEAEYWNLPANEHRDRVKERLEAWVEFFGEKERDEEAQRVEGLLSDLRFSDDIPF